jgi:cation transport protein ChaC
MEQQDDHSDDCWIFAYGSLIWRVDFEFLESRPASINHWARRFWQGSTDHRGIPDAPGRVVTLIEARGETCWGKAYRLNPNSRDQVLAHLDHREKGGYERLELDLYFQDGGSVQGLLYHATRDNPEFLGEQNLQSMARQIVNAHGPSGANTEYVLRLESALEALGARDDHVSGVADAVRKISLAQ